MAMDNNGEHRGEITRQLISIKDGDKVAYEKLYGLVYDHLRNIAIRELNRESGMHTLGKTDLVHESFLKLIDQSTIDWQDRRHFFGISARAMRQILIDYARKKMAKKRGGDVSHMTLNEDIMKSSMQAEELIEINDGLEELRKVDERLAEVVDLRFFAGLPIEEIAELMDSSRSTIHRDWIKARAWLYTYLKEQQK
ncbi:MAG: sigma-70 family RNA polymerase sigma factor [Balneolia bacterium]|nr:sigma-70 family RNA polymerase sigma factor [Balneolia bacterium]